MAKLKCWIGNYDGQRRALVIATSQAKAVEIVRCGSVHTFRNFYVEQEQPLMGAGLAFYAANTLYTQPMDCLGDARLVWIEGKCPLKKRT